MYYRQHHAWNSPALRGRHMDLLVLGHGGARVLAFPTSQGSYRDWEDRGMPEAIAEQLETGLLQLFCVGSADGASWYNESIPVSERAIWQNRYDRYIHDEVLPLTVSLNADPMLITAGASMGGYHALAFGTRHPELVGRVLSMSGMPDVRRLTGGWSDDSVYFNNPAEFLGNEHDADRVRALQRLDIILATGHDDPLCQANIDFSKMLWEHGIGNALRIWDGWAHDWPYWQRMLALYVGGHD